ncbi:MAG: AbrB/MazE/SpoVT family DNA-binding domain-containing protein [Candidatus Nitrosopolaris sp.]
MTKRTLTHLALVTKGSQSLRTVIPRSIAEKLGLGPSDMLEWLDIKGQIVVRKL